MPQIKNNANTINAVVILKYNVAQINKIKLINEQTINRGQLFLKYPLAITVVKNHIIPRIILGQAQKSVDWPNQIS